MTMRLAKGVFTRSLAMASLGMALLVSCPWEQQPTMQRDETPHPHDGALDAADFTRRTVYFTSEGESVEAWLYLPRKPINNATRPPLIILGHGIGAQKDMGLDTYCELFASAGYAALAFDYRGFGGSDGEPRHWVSPRRHLQDFAAALRFVKSDGLSGVLDAGRVALWGVSFGGGHALVTAARYPEDVAVVIANEPFVCITAALEHAAARRSVVRAVRLLLAAFSDAVRGMLQMRPLYVRLSAPLSDPSVLGLVPLRDSELGSSTGLRPDGTPRSGGWKNLVTARVLLSMLTYRPMSELHRVKAPVFVRAAAEDHLAPVHVMRKAMHRLSAARVVEYQLQHTTHIGAHKLGATTEGLTPVLAFLAQHLAPPPGAAETADAPAQRVAV